MRCTIACAMALPLVLAGCGEAVEPANEVARHGKLVKTCPTLRAVYTWQGKLYVKDGERYHQVDRTDDELCDMTARTRRTSATVECYSAPRHASAAHRPAAPMELGRPA
jgi:hypothetical protein